MTNIALFLLLQENYDIAFLKKVYGTPVVTVQQLVSGDVQSDTVRVTYRNRDSFKKLSKTLGLMDDFKVRCAMMANANAGQCNLPCRFLCLV